jgi:hypothetical protein
MTMTQSEETLLACAVDRLACVVETRGFLQPTRGAQIAWFVLLLCMAMFVGYQGACAFLISQQLAATYEKRVEANDDLVAAQAARATADANLARAIRLLRQTQDALHKQADHAPRTFHQEGFDAGQVSRL